MNRASKTALLSIFSNSLLIVMKGVVGFITGSVSILSEAIHSLLDLAAAVMAFFSIGLAGRPPDRDHPYGHEKIENISGVIEAVLIFVAAGWIIIEAVNKIVKQEPVQSLSLGIAVMGVSGLTNLFVSRRLYKIAREEESVALEADALHLKTDVLTSFGVAFGLLVIVILHRFIHAPWIIHLDPVVAITIAVFILKESTDMLRKAFAPLLDTTLSEDEIAAVERQVSRYPGLEMHDVRTRKAGKTKHIDFHVNVPEAMTVREVHELCDTIENDIEKSLTNTHVLIHPEPMIALNNSLGTKISKDAFKTKINHLCQTVAGGDISTHHFHLHGLGPKTELSFHVRVDGSTTVEDAHALATRLEIAVKEAFGFETTIHIEPTRK
jgi:cation diffusion facilitator family transporter